MIEIAITPNRPDALGVRGGVARDLAARGGVGTLKPLVVEAVPGGFKSPIGVEIDPALKAKGCPHFTGRLIRGVTNGQSPSGCGAGWRRLACGRFPRWSILRITSPSI